MKRRTHARMSLGILAVAVLAVTLGTGCLGLLGQLLSSILGIDLLGVTPASNFNQTGNVQLSLLPRSENGGIVLGGLSDSGLSVQMEDENGDVQDCDYVDNDTVVASRFNSLAVVLDSSGSMERTYPEDQYGDLCLTCPHDPDRLRVDAAADLIGVIRRDSPDSHIGVMDFGPDPSPGMSDTRVLEDFGTDTQALVNALDDVAGSEMAGTPMWDSLAEIILLLDQDATDYEDTLRSTGALTSLNPQPVPGNDVPSLPGDNTSDSTVTSEPQNPPLDQSGVRRVIVVITDGEDLDSDTYDLESVIDLANAHEVTIHAIGLGPASAQFDDPRAQALTIADAVTDLQRLAEGTGGYYASVHDATALETLYSNIASSLTQGYERATYSCRPTGAPPQAFTSGQRVNGYVSLMNGLRLPWSVIAP